jgi:hypothetical protein
LLIRVAEADDVADMDGQALVVGCSMAQVFEFPKGVTGERILSHTRPGSGESRREYPATQFSRSPLPARSVNGIGTSNMGLPPDRRKRNNPALARPATGPIPGSAIRGKINRFRRV